MKHLILIIIGFLIVNLTKAQEIDFSDKWINSIESNSGFKDIDKDKFDNLDFSSILSNQLRFDNDPISTYIGVFGANYHRIDFHLEVIKNGQEYSVKGKSKLGDNIRELKGTMNLKKILLRKDYLVDSLYIGLFDCILREPGDRDGDGSYSGIFTLVFYQKNGELHFFKSESGDEPTFTNTFVGKWTKNNSNIERKVIFSFHPAGLYEQLPFCDDLYTYGDNPDYTEIKEKYIKYGWSDFKQQLRGQKTDWWKD